MCLLASIFLGASHFFSIWRTPSSYLQGVFIDYWAPKLYASQLAVLSLWTFTALKKLLNRQKIRGAVMPHFRLKENITSSLLLILFLVTAVLGQALAPRPSVAFFTIISCIFGPFLFLVWLQLHQKLARNWLPLGIVLTTFFQASVGIFQTMMQKSVLGYIFFGEPTLTSTTLNLARSQWAHRILPYGTTPHPNVLGGWLVLGILFNILLWKAKSFPKPILTLHLFLSGVVLLLTESFSAWGALFLLLIAWRYQENLAHFLEQAKQSLRKRTQILALCVVISVLWVFLPQFLGSIGLFHSSPSITRRAAGIAVTLENLSTNPLPTGVLGHIAQFRLESTRGLGWGFLQPVHNGVLFLASDLGIWVIVLLLFFYLIGYYYYSLTFLLFLATLPFFSLDHYLISTNSGQYIVVIIYTFFMLMVKKDKPRT